MDAAATRPLDLVTRDFTATRPNELWVADLTYVATWRGFAYVAFVIDVFARRIVGWCVSSWLRKELCIPSVGSTLIRLALLIPLVLLHVIAGAIWTALLLRWLGFGLALFLTSRVKTQTDTFF